ncbi:MAG TPA: hypothetical protein VHI13_01035 [Candidatus Kapabacteria bacterium]|nr:hypothetical protein [Candidatus Kapabacteria bacterium]
MIVVKFGGAVLGGAHGLRQACSEIRLLPKPLLVVVSAFADVTNRLETLAELAVHDIGAARGALEALMEYHRAIACDVLRPDILAEWEAQVAPHQRRLEEVIEGLAIVRDLSPRTLDLIVHFGERFSSSLVLAALDAMPPDEAGRSLDAAGISALDLIITDAGHRFARPDIELTRARVREHLMPALAEHEVVVTEGYIARSTTGQATTMGRESSDYSATLLAELLGARSVTIYMSVPGVLTADPAHFSGTRTLPRLSYRMANTLAELGAKVLHPRTVGPVERAGIPLVITCIGGTSTTIGADGAGASSVVYLEDATLISAETATASASANAFVRAIAAKHPVVWTQRFRRRLQVLATGRIARTSLPGHLLGDAVWLDAQDVSVVSLVQEARLSGEDLSKFFEALGLHRPAAMQGGIEGPAISVALDRMAAHGAAATLHERLITSDAEAEQWVPHLR